MKSKVLKYMIASFMLFGSIYSFVSLKAQTHLQIHQINVGNGDAALIKFYDNNKLKFTMVIDGGLSTTNNYFFNYLNNFIPDMEGISGKKMIDWVILSHNHADHLVGLIKLFENSTFIIRNITDQGGYSIGTGTYPVPLRTVRSSNCVPFIARSFANPAKPAALLVRYVASVKDANVRGLQNNQNSIQQFPGFDTSKMVFVNYSLPSIGGVTPILHCIASNGFTQGSQGRMLSGAANQDFNANNFSYGWILEFGEFRFYSGGDIGGERHGGYIDQETPIANNLKTIYPSSYPMTGANKATNFPGHVCVMKTNHHGSTESSNEEFLETLSSSVLLTSAGHHSSWKIPTVQFINEVAANPVFGAKTGVYFSQLYDYPGNPARTTANAKFGGNPNYDYISPGDSPNQQYSYIIEVAPTGNYPGPPSDTLNIRQRAYFSVYKVRTSDLLITSQNTYLCHKPN